MAEQLGWFQTFAFINNSAESKCEHKPFAEFQIISVGQSQRNGIVKGKGKNIQSLQTYIAKRLLEKIIYIPVL